MKHKYHVEPRHDQWVGRLRGQPDDGIIGPDKEEVLARTIALAKEVGDASVYIHDHTGLIQEERTYPPRRDPMQFKG